MNAYNDEDAKVDEIEAVFWRLKTHFLIFNLNIIQKPIKRKMMKGNKPMINFYVGKQKNIEYRLLIFYQEIIFLS